MEKNTLAWGLGRTGGEGNGGSMLDQLGSEGLTSFFLIEV